MLPEDEFIVLKSSLSTLRSHFIWPKVGKVFNPGKKFWITFSFTMVTYFPFAFGCVGHIVINIKRHVAEFIVEDIALISSMVGTLYIVILFMIRQQQLAHFYKDLSNFSEFGKPDDFDVVSKKLDLYSYMYTWYCGGGGLVYGTIAILEAPKCRRLNEELGLDEICGVFAPIYFPFEVDYFPMKQIVVCFQMYTCYMLLRISSCITFTTYESAQHIILRIRHLRRLIAEMVEIVDYKEKKERLVFCIKYHTDIIRHFQNYDKCYSRPMGVHITLTGVILGCIANQLVKKIEIGPLIHVVGWTSSLFVVCSAGQTITSESSEITTSAYSVDWHRMPRDFQTDMKLMLLVSQKPFNLHASFQILSYALFLDIIKKAYSYMTLLNQTTAAKT